MYVLLGIDGNDPALEALERTVERARAAGDDLIVAVYATGEADPADAEAQIRDRLETLSFEAGVRLIEDDPGGRLVELVDSDDFDRIVIPGGHRSPLGKIRLDHVAEFVLLNANASVTLLR